MREAVAESERPVMLYSIGKDSSVMLHLARKAFFPAPPPFPLLHVDTTWKFRQMYEFRDKTAAELGIELLVHQNPECLELGINPFTHGSAVHTDMWKTQGLKQALDKWRLRPRLRRRAPRRGEVAGQGAGLLAPLGAAPLGPQAAAPRALAHLQRAAQPRRDPAGLPAVELDRARRVAVHPPRGDPHRAAVLRRAAAGRRAGRRADHGGRRPLPAPRRRGAAAAQRALPDPRLLSAQRRRGEHAPTRCPR